MQSAWKVRGSAGRLKAGSRLAATLGPWKAEHIDGERWRFTFDSFEPDVYWQDGRTDYKAILDIGRGDIRGEAEIVGLDPLVIEMEVPRE